jgi:hypothetical protein
LTKTASKSAWVTSTSNPGTWRSPPETNLNDHPQHHAPLTTTDITRPDRSRIIFAQEHHRETMLSSLLRWSRTTSVNILQRTMNIASSPPPPPPPTAEGNKGRKTEHNIVLRPTAHMTPDCSFRGVRRHPVSSSSSSSPDQQPRLSLYHLRQAAFEGEEEEEEGRLSVLLKEAPCSKNSLMLLAV